MNLGLKRGEVRVVPHDTEWAGVFDEERRTLVEVLGDAILDIQHVGSTAVAGLVAKPVIDIAVAVRDLPGVTAWVPKLETLGYTFFGDREGRGELFFAKGPEHLRTVYLHVVERGGKRMEEYVRFRDRLIRNPPARAAYSALKEELAALHGDDRKAYTEGKAEFIAEMLGSP
jgi:GrpB-like predicted nucleotidyltransferase (UPF0157 family)